MNTTNRADHQAHQVLNPETLYNPTPYGYSHVAAVEPDNKLIFVAGQGGGQHEEATISNFRSQVQQAFENLRLALTSQDCTMADIIKLTTLIVDHNADKHRVLIEESEKHWPDKSFPTQSLIPVPRLAVDGMLFEVEAVAAKSAQKQKENFKT